MPKGIPLTEEKQIRRRKEIFVACAQLIIKKGFHETSMREIAEASGIGKSTLYDYFRSKDEILLSFLEEEIQGMTAWAEQVSRQDLSAREKLRRIMQKHLDYLVANKSFYLRLNFEAQRLKLQSQGRIQVSRYAYQDLIRGIVEEGIRNGEFRPVNPLLAVRSIFAILTPAVFTSRPTGTPQEMMDETLDIFFNGMQA